ncbi:DJ-1/PfpI family protein [Flavobacterium muglaense]|uniref:DJ-1/PfpI family protein n=1 Tax=Flavobacterium muglaense TaxID=2764716 RepID=A0A923SH50_9FLAO|nr:DJ-1/PfpI family protein [Flavobacterium muglaense]MBC5839754.1 DJ-1/PfpI family protein [Flavobacterium muglaense]MBC5846280.1 DJ-1/PfpI family protein [Flavobacterium muglaense]
MKRVLLLLADGFEIYEASVFIDVIGWNLTAGNGETELFTCGIKKETKSTFNQTLIVDFLLDEIKIDDFEALAIPGGFEEYNFYAEAYNNKFTEIIKSFHEKEKIIASICTGAFPIAKSGILEGKKGTTYNQNPVRQETLRNMGVNVVNEPIVLETNIITSWNPSTAMDVAFLLLEKLTNKENTNLIKKKMGF